MIRKLIIFLSVFFFVFASPKKTNAASENFVIKSNVVYTISESGNTNAVINGSLTNATDDFYASSYSITVGFPSIQNIRGSDPEGPLSPELTKTDEGYTINLPFKTRNVGKGKTMQFNIQFDTPNIAKKHGNIWEVNIPGLTNQSDFDDFTVRVIVPSSFGKPSYIKPSVTLSGTDLLFTKEQLKSAGISLAFGQKQTYAFTLTYHLKNSNIFPIRTEIALPPTTNYQEVAIESISEKPISVEEDADGNWLAKFSLLPSEKKDVKVKGKIELSLLPKQEPMTDSQLAPYLNENDYWQTSNPKVKELAATLKTPRAIYEYLTKNLTYDFSRVTDNKGRAGAAGVLANPASAVCLEFTDAFIALARAAGVPTRGIDGFGFSKNDRQRPLSLVQDILHAWPEYYDAEKQTWIMIDPTWGNTTGGVDYFDVLDFDHIAFVIKGHESDYPIPAGGYKQEENESEKDVEIVFTQEKIQNSQNIKLELNIPKYHPSLLPLNGSVKVTNTSTTVLDPQTVSVYSVFQSPQKQNISLKRLPPGGNATLSFSFDKPQLLTNKKDVITIAVGGKIIKHTVSISPFAIGAWMWVVLGVIISCAILIAIIYKITIRAGRLRLQKQAEPGIIRGQSKGP